MDFETRGVLDLKKVGSWVYSEHELTEAMCLAYCINNKKPKLWHMAHPDQDIEESPAPEALFAHIRAGGIVECHNAFFERSIWNNIMVPRYGWPEIKHEQWRCSAALAAAHSLPRALEDVAKVLHLHEQKDKEGHRLMLKMSKPIKLTKKQIKQCEALGIPTNEISWHEKPEDLERLWAYCIQDVRTERGVSEALTDLHPKELKIWQLDQATNERGIYFDRKMIQSALALADQAVKNMNLELQGLTGIERASRRSQIKIWLSEHEGVDMPDTKGKTLDDLLLADDLSRAARRIRKLMGEHGKSLERLSKMEGLSRQEENDLKTVQKQNQTLDELCDLDRLSKRARRIIEIVRSANRTSTAKYKAMLLRISNDNRIRDTIMYAGAHTLRWCLPGNAEVLTENGWQKLIDWDESPIAQWNTSHEIDFLPANKVEFKNQSGEMHRLVHPKLEILATSEHEFPVKHLVKGGYSNITAEEFGVHAKRMLPLAGVLQSEPSISAIETQITVMFQADGHIVHDTRRGKNYRSFKLAFKKKRKISRCRALLKEAKILFAEHKRTGGGVTFYIADRNAPPYLAKAKEFSSEILKHDLKVFLDEVKFWDGTVDKRIANTRGSTYFSCSETNARWVQTIAHLQGLTANIFTKRLREHGWSDCHVVTITGGNKSGNLSLRRKWKNSKIVTQHKKVYCAETETGYFLCRYKGRIFVSGNSGKGVQPHNFPRGNIKDMDGACRDILTNDLAWVGFLNGDVMQHLSFSLRGAITATPGHELFTADFAAIEARVVFWLARAQNALEVFARGGDIYCEMGKTIYRRTITKEDDPEERQLAKGVILGCGFSMGFVKFLMTIRKSGISFTREQCRKIVPNYDELKKWVLTKGKQFVEKNSEEISLMEDLHELVLCKYLVDTYRKQYPEVVQLWKDMEKAAISAVLSPGRRVQCGAVSWYVEGRFLVCELPSGRNMYYCDPRVSVKKNPWGGESKVLSYMGVNPDTRRWQRIYTYSGKLVENVVQAIARDLMAWAMLRLDKTGVYKLLTTIHDELIAEAKVGRGDAKEYEKIVAFVPKWAKGCPIGAEGKRLIRYQK